MDKFASPALNTLFFEPRFVQAMMNTFEIQSAQINPNNWPCFPGARPQDVPGHHGQVGKFNVGYVDGHAKVVTLLARGSMNRVADYQQMYPRNWKLHWRAKDWWYDSYDMAMVRNIWFQGYDDPRQMWDEDIVD